MTIWSMNASTGRQPQYGAGAHAPRAEATPPRAIGPRIRTSVGITGVRMGDRGAGYATMLGAVADPIAPHFTPDRGAGRGRPIVLTGADLTIADVEAVARAGAQAQLDVHARARMAEARAVIE